MGVTVKYERLQAAHRLSMQRHGDQPVIALIQRVSQASVQVDGEEIAAIGPGLLALAAVERGDTPAQAARLAERILGYRVFEDTDGRMNLSLADTGGGLLLVSQFTLAADTQKGMRPSFTPAAEPAAGLALFDLLVAETRRRHAQVETGRFGARMSIALVNDGPVTFWLRARPDSSTCHTS